MTAQTADNPDPSDSPSGENNSRNILGTIGYTYAFLAFAMFVYCFFISDQEKLNEQAIYWFFSSLIAAVLPTVKQLKYGDLEVFFRGEISKVTQELQARTEEVKKVPLPIIYRQQYEMQKEFLAEFQAGRFDQSLVTVDKTLEMLNAAQAIFPDDPYLKNTHAYALKNRAMATRSTGRGKKSTESLDEAARIFEEVRQAHPDNADAWNGLGSVALLRDDPKEALRYIDKALELKPDYLAAKHDREVAEQLLRQKGE